MLQGIATPRNLCDSAAQSRALHPEPYHNSSSALSCAGRNQTAQVEQLVDEKPADEASHHTPPESREFVSSQIRRDESRYDAVGLRKDGTRIIIEVSGKNCLFDGEPARLAAVRDVTERKNLEEQLQQAQRMEAIGRLAGGIAHDFNNLLTAITGYSDLTLRKLNELDPLRANIEEVGKAAQRAAKLCSSVVS